jgi:lipopolysaccharide export system protein LptC
MQLGARTAIAFPLVLLAFIAMITYWINYTVQPELPKIDGSSRHDPDYIMSNFETTQTDIKGDLRYKLAAIEMRHFPDDDTTELQQPRYTQFAVNKPYTRVTSERGFVSSDGEEVKLFDNVVVTRQAFEGKGEMTVETDYLNILPNEELVTTDRPVVIKQAPKTVIYATGMIYEKKKQTVTLLNRVRAHYEKPVLTNAATQTKQAAQKPVKPQPVQQKTDKQATTDTTQPNTKNARIRRSYE